MGKRVHLLLFSHIFHYNTYQERIGEKNKLSEHIQICSINLRIEPLARSTV